jgi:hypothetical protein
MNGELRHETCRFGRLTEAWIGGDASVVPLCTWAIPDPAPPALLRAWGGRVEPERDCKGCAAYRAVEIAA